MPRMTAESPGASNQTFLAADVVGFGDQRRTTKDQLTIRAGLYLLMRLAIEGAGIAWDRCHIEDRGDGLLVMAPADIPPRLFTAALPGSLVVALNEYNRR